MDAITKFKNELIKAALVRAVTVIVCGIIIAIDIILICAALREAPLAKGHIPHDLNVTAQPIDK